MAKNDSINGRRLWRAIVLANVLVAVAIVLVGALAVQVRLDAVRDQVVETASAAADRWLEHTQAMDTGQRVNLVDLDEGARSSDYEFFEGAMAGTRVAALEFHDVNSAQSLTFVKNAVSGCRTVFERAFVVAGMNQSGSSRFFTNTASRGTCPEVIVVSNAFLPESVHVGTFLRIAVDATEDYAVFLAEMHRSSRLAVLLAALGLGSTLLTSLLAWRLAQREQRIRHIASHDALTGLSNRFEFHRTLDARFRREGDDVRATLLLLDLDGFKAVNDMLGHDYGDALLTRVGGRMRAMVRGDDTVARLGGDEFAIVLWGTVPEREATDFAMDLIDAINAIDNVNGVPVSVGASVGISSVPEHALSVEDLTRTADIALYYAKERGKGHARIFDDEIDAAQQTRYAIRHALKKAIRTNTLPVVYQPIHAAQTGELRGFEALARLTDDYGAAFFPDDFIPIAQEMRVVEQLGAAVMRTACTDVAPLGDTLKVSVNVSPSQVEWPLIDVVKDALAMSGLPARRLELEIVESEEIPSSPAMAAIARTLRSEGVSIALDDFGSGYANLTYLWELPLDRVKIDRKVFAAAGTRARAKAVVQRFGIFGSDIGLKMTAEGIETDEQWSFAVRSGYEEVQGYYFSRPLTADALPDYVEQCRRMRGVPPSAVSLDGNMLRQQAGASAAAGVQSPPTD